MLEKLANIATLVLVIVACAFAYNHWLYAPKPIPPPYQVGDVLTWDMQAGSAALALVTRSSCVHCVNDLPNTRRLAEEAHRSGVAVVAVAAEPLDVHERWLRTSGVMFDEMKVGTEVLPKVIGTPSFLIISRDGTGPVTVRWIHEGELSTSAIADAMALIKKDRS